MKKTSTFMLSLFLILILVAGCGGGGGTPSTPPTTGSVTGTVSSTSTPLSVATNTDLSIKISPIYNNDMSKPQSVSDEKVMTFRSGLSYTEVASIVDKMGAKIKNKIYGSDNTYVISIENSKFISSSSRNNPNILSIEDNLISYATKVPNDTYYATHQVWNYSMLFLPQAWDYQTGNSTIIVAVIDTGVSLNNPDLRSNLVQGYDFVDNDSDPSDITYLNEDNRYSHGTHVAGIISACTNNGSNVAGVAWNVKIMPIRVLGNDGSGSASAITSGINYARLHGAKVINLSLGGRFTAAAAPASYKQAIDDAINAGITVVAATGNDNSWVSFPANYTPVIAVASLGPDGLKASYSNFGPEVDVCAPGGASPIVSGRTDSILSISYDKLNRQDCLVYMSGTSQACPHISGIVALLYSRGMTSPAQIEARLTSNVIDKGTLLKDDIYGFGMPRADNVISGAPFGLAATKVFYGMPDGTMGTLYDADGIGNYNITGLLPGQKYICAFLDKDNDGKVDSGEWFGYQSVSVQIGVTSTVNITMSTVAAGVSDEPLSNYIKTHLH